MARARAAAALRDSLLKVNPNFEQQPEPLGGDSLVERRIQAFLAAPYDVFPAPTLGEIDAVAAAVNLRVAEARHTRARDLARAAAGGQSVSGPLGAPTGALGAGVEAARATGVAWLPSQADILRGGAEFFVNRAQDEVAFSFVLNLRERVRGDQWLQVALPQSRDLIERMDTETFQTFMPLLHAAFMRDLDDLPARIDIVAEAFGIRAEHRAYLEGMSVVFQRGLEIRAGSPPAVAMANLVQLDEGQVQNPVIRRAMQFVGLLAREYAAAGGEPFIQELANRDRGWQRRYFVALVGHDMIRLDPGLRATASDFLEALQTREADAVLLLNQLHSLPRVASDARTLMDSAATEARAAVSSPGAVMQLLQAGSRFLIDDQQQEVATATAAFQRFVADATTLYESVSNRQYGAVVTWLLRRPELDLCRTTPVSYDALLATARAEAEQQADRLDALDDVRANVRARRGAPTEDRTAEQDRRRERLIRQAERAVLGTSSRAARLSDRACEWRLQYLSFAASLAGARTEEEVTVALRTASAPVGSYRSKRNQDTREPFLRRWGPTTASVVGYPGLTFGWERPAGGRLPGRDDANHVGLSLPVGIEISRGSPLGAFSLFASVIDLGTLASARFNGDEESDESELSTTPELGFGQVFAPGIFFMVNARGWPLSLGFGLQSVGNLRERSVTASDGSVTRTERVDVVRASVILGVDATLFHFRF